MNQRFNALDDRDKNVMFADVKAGTNLKTERIQKQIEALSILDREDLPFLAKGDQAIKGFVVAVEDDFDAQFIRPRLRALQSETAGKAIELGIVQRTSILAGNRRSSRVDPKASIEFNMPEGPDLLQEAISLARVATKVQTAVATGGASEAVSSLGASAPGGGILQGLQGLAGTTAEQAPQIYKIETGAGFEIMPILLPDAQTVAFDLNYILTTPVGEPENAKDRRITRVERHAMRTYVQDSNYELRELSRFESQTKLKRPDRRSGGVPLLRNLPIIREIPLIGYFKRAKGSAAGMQESLIFVHSVVYPTVSDLIPLF
ncbi:MAG: hypothetical protein M3347_13065 [Armatimonadota bacterium]|nr:hypothetical protein [Armatimonadota bacterium]